VPSFLDPNNLYVTGLDPALNKEQLDALFSKYGRVLESKLLIDINTGLSRGAGLLRFETSQQVKL
jgi:ELAV-like protein 1